MDKDRMDHFRAQLTGEKPIEADPLTGFHRDQLHNKALTRMGPNLYATHVDGVVGSNQVKDAIVVNTGDMGAYSKRDKPDAEEFERRDIWYSVILPDTETFNGTATLAFADIEEYMSNEEYGSFDFLENQGEDTASWDLEEDYPRAILQTEGTASELESVARRLEEGEVFISVKDYA